MENVKLAALLLVVLLLSACTRDQTSIQLSVENSPADSLCTEGVQATLTFDGSTVESPIVMDVEGWQGSPERALLRRGNQKLSLTARCITEDGEGYIKLEMTTELIPEPTYIFPVLLRITAPPFSDTCDAETEDAEVVEMVSPAPCIEGFDFHN